MRHGGGDDWCSGRQSRHYLRSSGRVVLHVSPAESGAAGHGCPGRHAGGRPG